MQYICLLTIMFYSYPFHLKIYILLNQFLYLVRSFKAFLLIGVLFLVCLLVSMCPMIDASRMNVVRELGRV
jgi:hypothetical protein